MKMLTFLLLFGVLLPSAAAAQAPVTISGQVVGADGQPLPDQDVVLHRVDATGGSTIAEAVTADDGRFTLNASASADTSAVYFVAARFDGELYIGPPFKPGLSEVTEQRIQVGVPGMSASAMLAQPEQGSAIMPAGGRAATSRTWLLLAVPLVGVALVAVFMIIPRSRIPEHRSLLVRVAQLDEAAAAAADADRDRIVAERTVLMSRLRTG